MAKLRSVPVVALCALYLFLAAGVALLSTSVYRSVEASSNEHSQSRVALSYVLSQLRAGDTAGGVRTLEFGDGEALAIADGEDYETLLYCYDGYLMELFAERDLGLPPEAGMQIAEAESIEITVEDDLVQLRMVDAFGQSSQTSYHMQSRQEVNAS